MDDKTFGSRLRAARNARDLTQEQLADLVGKHKSVISRAESEVRDMKNRDIQRISAALGVRQEWLVSGSGEMIDKAHPQKPDDVFVPSIIPGERLVSQERGLPVYAAAKGGDGHVIITFDPISYMKMPAVLQGVKGGYGLLLSGESMVPAYRPGETALVNPNLPPVRDEDVILYHTSAMDENEAIIKRLVGFNDREWMLEQYNPHKEFKEFRADWPVCHRVVGKYNTR